MRLQIGGYLTLAFKPGFRFDVKAVTVELVEQMLLHAIGNLELAS